MVVGILALVVAGVAVFKADRFMANDQDARAAAWLLPAAIFLIVLYNIVN